MKARSYACRPLSILFSNKHVHRIFAALIFTGALAYAATASAATITVNSLGDTLNNGDGVCTIREAMINANNDAATWSNCAAGSGVDTINLPAGTITITIPNTPSGFAQDQVNLRGDFDISSSMIINGNVAGTTINGADLDRIFDINPDTDFDPMTTTPVIVVTINRLTMTNGFQNQAGAIAVFPNATLAVNDSTISESRAWADDGGGMYIFGGAVTMTNCTVSGNTAYLHSGGIRADGTLALVNCTITDNDSDFDNLSGGLWNSSALATNVTLRNTIVAGNHGVDCPNLLGSFTSLGYNIVGEFGTIVGSPIITPTTGDQFDVSDASVMLGALTNNGGPTPTHALGAGSIAIDKGHSSGSVTDQRGLTRPCDLAAVANATGGDGGDVGAFEVQGTCGGDPAPPDAVDDAATVAEDSGANTTNVLANDTDPNFDSLTIISVTQGTNGSVAITGGGTSVSYTPAPDFFGPDSFTYTITDGNGGMDTATVSVNVTNVNDPPAANNDNYSMNQDTTLLVLAASGVLANDTDIDSALLTASLVNGPSNAQSFVLNADGSFSYTPLPGFTGIDTFDYVANDGTDDSNLATVTITINDTQAPSITCSVATAQLWPPNSDMVNVGFTVTATDNDGFEPTVQIDVFSDEDDEEQVAQMSPDAKDIASGTLRLRAERRGDGDGRVYVIRIKATDSSNNTAYAYCAVGVPKSQSKADVNSANAQAAAAVVAFVANGNNPPAGFFSVGDGPVVGPKQ